jgi:hypothetical protein
MKMFASFTAVAGVLTLAASSQATILGFGQLGGNNTTVPAAYGSGATANANGLVVSNGATPNVALTWDANWDIHTSNFFAPLEGKTVGGGAWDNENSVPRVGQLDFGTHTVGLSAAAGFAVVLNSFDFGHTAETAGTTNWIVTLTDAGATPVWSQAVEFVNGSTVTLSPNFTGTSGGSYTLTFSRTASTYGSDGRHGIDNFSFNQVVVPEPVSASLIGMGALALKRRRAR